MKTDKRLENIINNIILDINLLFGKTVLRRASSLKYRKEGGNG